jgi:aromatic ring-opening dioxygenase catalytic subunit (LigB family)
MKRILSYMFFATVTFSISMMISNYAESKIALLTSGSEAHNFIAEAFSKQELYINKQKSRIKLASNFKDLGMKSETRNYRYKYQVKSHHTMIITSITKKSNLYHYIGAGEPWSASDNYKMVSVICRTLSEQKKLPNVPVVKTNRDFPSASCASGTSPSIDN